MVRAMKTLLVAEEHKAIDLKDYKPAFITRAWGSPTGAPGTANHMSFFAERVAQSCWSVALVDLFFLASRAFLDLSIFN